MKRQNGLVKLRKRPTKDGGASLYLEIADGTVRTYEFLRLYLVPERTRIDKIQNAETLRTAEAAKAQRLIELQNTAHGFSNSRLKGGTLFVQYIEEKAKEGTIGTNGTYYELLYHLRAYSPKITLRGINRQFLQGFIQYLRNVGNKRTGRKLAPNTVWTICNKMNVFLNKAVRDDLIPSNPYNALEGKERATKEPVNRAYLTADEIKILSETPCQNEQVKRAFLFCCFCGLRFSDVKALKWGDIRTLSDGTKQAEIRQQKTREPLYLPLSKNALKWIWDKLKAFGRWVMSKLNKKNSKTADQIIGDIAKDKDLNKGSEETVVTTIEGDPDSPVKMNEEVESMFKGLEFAFKDNSIDVTIHFKEIFFKARKRGAKIGKIAPNVYDILLAIRLISDPEYRNKLNAALKNIDLEKGQVTDRNNSLKDLIAFNEYIELMIANAGDDLKGIFKVSIKLTDIAEATKLIGHAIDVVNKYGPILIKPAELNSKVGSNYNSRWKDPERKIDLNIGAGGNFFVDASFLFCNIRISCNDFIFCFD